VFLVVRGRSLAAGIARYLRKRIAHDPAVNVLLGHEVKAVSGGEHLEQVIVEETGSGERQALAAGAMVVLIGAQPRTQWLAGQVALDEDGFISSGPSSARFSPMASPGRRWDGNHLSLRPVVPACSQWGTFDHNRPRWSRPRPETAAWPCGSRASTLRASPLCDVGVAREVVRTARPGENSSLAPAGLIQSRGAACGGVVLL
jgi:hypothetical protein